MILNAVCLLVALFTYLNLHQMQIGDEVTDCTVSLAREYLTLKTERDLGPNIGSPLLENLPVAQSLLLMLAGLLR